MLVPCDTEYPAFVSERTIKETVGNIDCESCVKYVQYSDTHTITEICAQAHIYIYWGLLKRHQTVFIWSVHSHIILYS